MQVSLQLTTKWPSTGVRPRPLAFAGSVVLRSAIWMAPVVLSLLLAIPALGASDEEQSIVELLRQWRSSDEKTRRVALERLREMRKEAIRKQDDITKRAVEELMLEALRDRNDQIVSHAVAALTFDTPRSAKAIPVLIDLIRTQSGSDLWQAAVFGGLMNFGPEADAGIPPLLELLANPKTSVGVRASVIAALSFIGPKEMPVVAAIRKELLTDQDDKALKQAVILALGRLGESAKGASQDLITFIRTTEKGARSKHRQARELAIIALGKIDSGEDTIQVLSEVIRDNREEDSARLNAIAAIAEIGPKARLAIPALISVLDRKSEASTTKTRVVIALRQIGESARPVADRLRTLAASTRSLILRDEINRTLKAIGAE